MCISMHVYMYVNIKYLITPTWQAKKKNYDYCFYGIVDELFFFTSSENDGNFLHGWWGYVLLNSIIGCCEQI